jgi:hypothetical protein
MQIYVHKNNQQLGPFTEAEIRAQLAAGTISLQDHVWWQAQPGWLPLGQTPLGAPTVPGVTLVSGPPAVPPHGVMPAAHRGTSQLAIWSLVCGCLSLLCGLFASVPAIILGHMSLSEIRKNPALEGRGMAMAGLIIGYLFVGIFFIAVFCALLFVSLGNNMQDVFKTITAQVNAQSSTDDSSTNSDSTTNAPDTSTNSPTATPITPDSSTNAAPASQ